jgi:hypothetical protein
VLGLLANGLARQDREEVAEPEVVRKLRALNPKTMARIRANLTMNLTECIQVLTEDLLDRHGEMVPEAIGKNLHAVGQLHQLLSGGATSRVETRSIASPEDLQKMFEALPSAEATVVETNGKSLR